MGPRDIRIVRQARRTLSGLLSPQSDCSLNLAETISSSKRPQLEMRISRRGFGVVGLLSTLCVFLVTGGIATLILGWLYAHRDAGFVGGGLFLVLKNGTFAIREPSRPEDSLSPGTQSESLRILMFSALAVSRNWIELLNICVLNPWVESPCLRYEHCPRHSLGVPDCHAMVTRLGKPR